MTKQEFESLAGNIVLNAMKLDRGEMTQKEFMQAMKMTFDEKLFEKAEKILNEN